MLSKSGGDQGCQQQDHQQQQSSNRHVLKLDVTLRRTAATTDEMAPRLEINLQQINKQQIGDLAIIEREL